MICVFTPYDRSETTAAALALASFIRREGCDVRVLSATRVESGVHPEWDREVLSLRPVVPTKKRRRVDQSRRLQDVRRCVHFQYSAEALSETSLIRSKVKQIFVPSWHSMPPLTRLADFDAVICPTAKLRAALDGKVSRKKLSCQAFVSEQSATGFPRQPDPGPVSLCVFADASAIAHTGAVLLVLIEELLLNTTTHVRLLSTKTWCDEDRRNIRRLKRLFEGKFSHRLDRSIAAQNEEFSRADLTFVASTKADFGVAVSRSLVFETTPIAYNIAPFSEIIKHRENGFLLPCAYRENAVGAPVAVPTLAGMLDGLTAAVNDKQLLATLRQRPFDTRVTRQFEEYWRVVLDMPAPGK